MSEVIAIRINHHLQKDVHFVQDSSQGRIMSIIKHNLSIKHLTSYYKVLYSAWEGRWWMDEFYFEWEIVLIIPPSVL